ncbi:MAG TPA: endonuclease/exonuclease/phosphatase family protein [Jatrophihabitans sp.]|nr:endonuclease/exonuclease/phosphatase family protein [Jatrophihabitans sp.]
MPVLRRPAVAGAAATVLAAATITATLAAPAAATDLSSPVVLSEVYGGGGNSGAPYQNDFIELFNHGTAAVDVSSWSVQYGSAGGTSWQFTPLTGSIPAGGYYLIAEGGGAGNGAPLPTPNATGTIALSATSGKVALVGSQTALTGCGTGCDAAPGVIDFLGFGSANDAAGSPAPALSNTTSAQRAVAPFANTGNNAADFTTAAPTPAAAPDGGTTPPPGCDATPTPPECVPGATTVQDVQGDGFRSPLVGQSVDRVEGVVTAVRSSGSRGFWLQQPHPDASRSSASSGVFVYTSSASVAVGDDVLVTGKVSEYYPLGSGETLSDTSSLSTTELTPTVVTKLSSGNPLPPALVIGPDTVPDLYAPSTSSGDVESISTVDPTRSALEFYEAHEGMLVEVDNARVVGPGKQKYGEIYVTTKPDQHRTYRGGTYVSDYNTPSGRLLVTAVTGTVPAANVGDELTGATSGPLDWSLYGGYDIAATRIGGYQDNHLQPTVATPQAADQLAVATYNVENLSPTDAQSKFDTLGAGVVTNLASPDIVSLEEIQDNDGATDDGVVAADQTLTKLTAAIAAAGGPSYRWSEIDPTNDADGGQPGGNIRNVFLYNPDRVSFVARPGGDATTAVAVSTGADGTPELSVSPGRVDPTNPAWNSSRKPLAGEFVFQGKKVIVVGNHFDAKLGDQDADGRFQPPTRSSEVQRQQQASVLNNFVKQVLAADPRANIVLAGDFNDYQFSPAMKTLTSDGATLTDLITTLPADQQYTYVYDGLSQVLDHIFVSTPLSSAAGAVSYEVIHVNSEFAAQASDHDPQVVRIRPVPHSLKGTVAVSPGTVRAGGKVTVRLAGWNPNTALALSLDGTASLGSVTTDAAGAASTSVAIAKDTKPGAHAVVATAADGTASSATLQVSEACVPFPGPHATLRQYLAWLIAVLTGHAC